MRHRVQGIIIQNGKAILGYGCVDKINKTFRHYFIGGGIETRPKNVYVNYLIKY